MTAWATMKPALIPRAAGSLPLSLQYGPTLPRVQQLSGRYTDSYSLLSSPHRVMQKLLKAIWHELLNWESVGVSSKVLSSSIPTSMIYPLQSPRPTWDTSEAVPCHCSRWEAHDTLLSASSSRILTFSPQPLQPHPIPATLLTVQAMSQA